MPKARIRYERIDKRGKPVEKATFSPVYELVQVTAGAEYVLSDGIGTFSWTAPPDGSEDLEIQCGWCHRWVYYAAQNSEDPDLWVCHGTFNHHGERCERLPSDPPDE